MKKLFLLFALGVSLCANAQLTVFENGRVRAGDYSPIGMDTQGTLDISSQETDSPKGSISFGAGNGAIIEGQSMKGRLDIYAGMVLNIGTGAVRNALTIRSGNPNLIGTPLEFRATSFLTTSDARLKKNVSSLEGSTLKLQDVNAVSYNLTQPSLSEDGIMALKESTEEPTTIEDERTHFGFIAQEIQKIYPNLVVEDEEGMIAIDYTGFIPLLVEAYKDLAGKVKEQEEVIDALIAQKGPSYMPASVNGLTESKATLKQNKPNPFNTTTTIECSVPQSVASAFICVYDLQGKQVHRIDIRERGDILNVIDASYFAPGMYIYALIADGVEIDSKRMIITD